jgi:hypothetical protein
MTLRGDFLADIVNLFLNMMDASKKDDEEREFAAYQHAINDFAFGFSEDRINVSIEYFSKLAVRMKKTERGVPRQEICLRH